MLRSQALGSLDEAEQSHQRWNRLKAQESSTLETLMRLTVGPLMGVKASGGIRDAKIANDMIAAGATRLGTSASIAIVTDAKSEGKGY